MIITIIQTHHFAYICLHHANRQSIATNNLIALCWERGKGTIKVHDKVAAEEYQSLNFPFQFEPTEDKQTQAQ